MSRRSAILALLCTLLLGSAFWLPGPAAGSPQNTSVLGRQDQARGQTTTNANPALDACALLKPGDVTAVLDEPLQQLKPTAQAAGNMNMSQCLFVTRDPAKSASMAVATPASADSGARSLRAFWRSQFHSPPKQEEERRPASHKTPAESAFSSSREARETGPPSESEAEEDARKPRPVPALGEEALGRQPRLRRSLRPPRQPLSPNQRGRRPQRIHPHRQIQVPSQRHPPPPP